MVSIIVVNYNGIKFLDRCLGSLFTQTHKDYEVLLVDNASQDESVSFVKSKFPECKVIPSEKNLGFAGGNNLGISHATGDLILLLNNDTWLDPDFLEKIVAFYDSHNFDVVAPYEAYYDGQKKDPYVIKIDPLGHPVYLKSFEDSDSGFYLSGVCILFSKKLYMETQGLDGDFFMYFEETDWFWRLNLMGKVFSYVPELYVYHAGAGSTGSGIKYLSFLWRNQNTLQMLLKNYLWRNLLWVLPLYFAQNIGEIFFFLVLLKPKISFSYLQGWFFNIQNFRGTMRKRKWVQNNRV
ncbi:MAG TPA: glycosyltransferase family 2 protein, partial [bacterium]|nr:glycosyltransferase family 2 protein [bacterium]